MAGIRTFKLAITAFALLAPCAVAQPPQSHTKPASIKLERAADSYAIYSLLMPALPFDGISPHQAPDSATAGPTVNINDMTPAIPPDGQLQPPPDNEKAFR